MLQGKNGKFIFNDITLDENVPDRIYITEVNNDMLKSYRILESSDREKFITHLEYLKEPEPKYIQGFNVEKMINDSFHTDTKKEEIRDKLRNPSLRLNNNTINELLKFKITPTQFKEELAECNIINADSNKIMEWIVTHCRQTRKHNVNHNVNHYSSRSYLPYSVLQE